MSSTSQFNAGTDSPKTPPRSGDQQNMFMTPVSDKMDRYLFSSPANWGMSPPQSFSFPSPSNLISPPRNVNGGSGYLFYEPNLISPRNNFNFGGASPSSFQNVGQTGNQYSMGAPYDTHQQMGAYPQNTPPRAMKRRRSESLGSSGTESIEGVTSMNKSLQGTPQSSMLNMTDANGMPVLNTSNTPFDIHTFEEDALDSTSSNRPRKRQRMHILHSNQQDDIQSGRSDMNEGGDMHNAGQWMSQDGDDVRMMGNNILVPKNVPRGMQIPNAIPPNSLVSSAMVWQNPPGNRFIAQPFDLNEPKARRRLNFSLDPHVNQKMMADDRRILSQINQNDVMNQRHQFISDTSGQYSNLDESSYRKPRRKRKRKRKGHTIVDDNTGMKRGTWTDDEHERFLEALKLFKKGNWKEIAKHVMTRTRVQCASHAQKVEIRMKREQEGEEFDEDDED